MGGKGSWEGREGMGIESSGREGREGNGSMHPLGFSKVGAYVIVHNTAIRYTILTPCKLCCALMSSRSCFSFSSLNTFLHAVFCSRRS